MATITKVLGDASELSASAYLKALKYLKSDVSIFGRKFIHKLSEGITGSVSLKQLEDLALSIKDLDNAAERFEISARLRDLNKEADTQLGDSCFLLYLARRIGIFFARLFSGNCCLDHESKFKQIEGKLIVTGTSHKPKASKVETQPEQESEADKLLEGMFKAYAADGKFAEIFANKAEGEIITIQFPILSGLWDEPPTIPTVSKKELNRLDTEVLALLSFVYKDSTSPFFSLESACDYFVATASNSIETEAADDAYAGCLRMLKRINDENPKLQPVISIVCGLALFYLHSKFGKRLEAMAELGKIMKIPAEGEQKDLIQEKQRFTESLINIIDQHLIIEGPERDLINQILNKKPVKGGVKIRSNEHYQAVFKSVM
jgi:hypothetical protein